ncbi:hypothetical protein ACN47A_33945 [Myxococcus fulvus]|uniref:hypothetical protein n=1 Tax=Myxococcus fulvus TaxID=33 RepID=UPI003B9BEC96
MESLLELLGETAPYSGFFDVTADNDVVRGWFRPEQPRHAETTLLSCSEALRYLGLHTGLTCAAANPVKARHYYLAIRADLQVFPVEATRSEVFLCVSRLEARDDSRAFPICQVSGVFLTDTGERYAEVEGRVLALTEEAFVGLKGRDAVTSPSWSPGQPSPYLEPLRPMALEWMEPGRMLRATLPGFRREDFAGHFDLRALCPGSLLSANACSLVSHFPGYGRYWISRCVASFKDVAVPGQAQTLTCVFDGDGQFRVSVESAEGKRLAGFKLEAHPV